MSRFLIFAAIHSLLASRRVQERAGRSMGRAFRFYRLAYNILSIFLFGWVMAAYPMSPVLYFIPGAWGLLFYPAQLLVLFMLFRCAYQTGLSDFLGIKQLRGEGQRKTVLVKSGCYARVRHPQYGLGFLFLILNPVVSMKWLLLTALSTIYMFIGAIIEEKRLIDELGEDYANYRREVPMFIPRAGKR